MAITITVDNDRTTTPPNPPFDPLLLDETAGQQTPITTDDGNEIDITLTAEVGGSLGGFATAFNTFLNSAALGLTDAQKIYARDHDGASSTSTFVLVTTSAGETIDDLFFADSTGGVLAGVQVVGMQTLDGQNVYLWSNGNFGSSGDFCVATTSSTAGAGEVVAAFYLNEAGDSKSAQIQMVVFEPLEHNNDGLDPDDALNFTDALRVGASGSLSFDFDQLASSSSLWVAVGNSSEAVLVTGSDPDVDNTTGKKTNDSDVIHTSQGGAGATIGVNNQLFDNVGESATFTLVTGMTDLVGADDGVLSDYVVDDPGGPGIEYGGYIPNVLGAGIFISQDQGSPNATKSLDINVFATNNATEEEGFGYVYSNFPPTKTGDALGDDIAVNVTSVTITNNLGVDIGTWVLGADPDGAGPLQANGATVAGVTVLITGNNIDVNNFGIQYTISWTTASAFNRFTVVNEAGKWDIGRVDVDRTVPVNTPVGDKLFVEDDGPSITGTLTGAPTLTVDESTLGTDATGAFAGQFTPVYGTDGQGGLSPVTYALSTSGGNSGLVDTGTGNPVFLFLEGGQVVGREGTDATDAATGLVVFDVSVDASGNVTLDQIRPIVHPTLDPDESLSLAASAVVLTASVTDGDEDPDSTPLNIGNLLVFKDDGPDLSPPTQDALELVTDDTDLTPDLATLSTEFIFPSAPDFGNDGEHATTPIIYELRLNDPFPLDGDDPDSGLIDTASGDAIRFVTVGDDIVGIVDNDNDGVIEAGETLEAVRYSLTVDDKYNSTVTFTQTRAVYHASALPETVLPNTVMLDQTAIDGDGDVSGVESFDLGAISFILDDEPTIGPILDSIVDFTQGSSADESLVGDMGNDPNASPYTLTFFTPSLDVNGVTVTGVADSSTSVTYWADTDGDTVFGSAGDTAYYNLTLGDQGGPGDYTFTVLINPPNPFTEFTFDLLPSGANLFGVVTSGNSALLVIGQDPQFNADGNYTNASDVIHTSQGGDGATIGVNNQMFDPGDGAFFTFINDPDPDFISGIPGGLTSTEADDVDNIQYNEDGIGDPTKEVESAFLGISQTQANKPVGMTIEAFDIDGGPQEEAFTAELGQAADHVDITAVRVLDENGDLVEETNGNNDGGLSSTVNVTISGGVATATGLLRGYTIEWDTAAPHDQVLVTGSSGKFDVGRFGFLEGNDAPDEQLDFTARVTDGDADFAEASWTVGIDGSGIHDDGVIII
jgi:hypothetical protein